MTFRFGFELEGFFRTEAGIVIPPKDYPVDGFPGLCEVRTYGGQALDKAYYSLLMEYARYPFNTEVYEHVFSPAEKRAIRARDNTKDAVEISNIYGKEPKALGNRTLASFQINMSREVRPSYVDKDGTHPAVYGLFDFRPIIERLDVEFKEEIKEAHRQKGFYSVKDGCRVEYRSLPNTIFKTTLTDVTKLISRIKSAIEDN